MGMEVPVHLSIKNAPDQIVARLKDRAKRHHRSLQGELMAILEEAVRTPPTATAEEVLAEVRRRGLRTPSTVAAMVARLRSLPAPPEGEARDVADLPEPTGL